MRKLNESFKILQIQKRPKFTQKFDLNEELKRGQTELHL